MKGRGGDGPAMSRLRGAMRRTLCLPALGLGMLVLAAEPAWAHLMPAQQGTLNVLGNAVFAALSLPLSALRGVDDDRDGHLSAAELRAHEGVIRDQVARRVRLFDGDRAARTDFLQVMAEPDERDSTSVAGNTHFLVLIKSGFDAPPAALRIETDFWGSAAAEQQLTIRATRGADAEAVMLTPRREAHGFFRSPWQVLGDYVTVGVEHILFGADHLLFLLTIVVAAAGWRYRLGVVTSFTVAHSITLTLALLGMVRVPVAVVEPLIAASIVLMAVLNLRQRMAVASHRMAIVFTCGLLHGLGFASAIAEMGLHGAYRVVSVIGFNVGIEAGQALFLGAVLALAFGARVVARSRVLADAHASLGAQPRFARLLAPAQLVSLAAALFGAFWFLERLGAAAGVLA